MKFWNHWLNTLIIATVCMTNACGSDDTSTEVIGGSAGQGGAGGVAASAGSTGMGGETPQCERLNTDYPSDGWPACISDDGQWHLAGESAPSSQARIDSFEVIAQLLWRGGQPPSADDFLTARIEYAIDQGLDSRVQRRYDAHIMRPAEGVNCRGADHGELYPEYCVGPGRILPLITASLASGSMGERPLENAAKVEAGLLWFIYISAYKEAFTCADTVKDCDSSWAYYGGGETVNGATGFAKYVKALSNSVHADTFDALLGVRCWRDLDAGESAVNTMLHAQVLEQLDRSLDRGLALILASRIETLRALAPEQAEELNAGKSFLRILGPVSHRAFTSHNPTLAQEIAPLWSGELDDGVLEALLDALNSTFDCA
jgi:hypothetical protein